MRKITVEELDIVVQASVEQALTEFKKIVPQLKKTIKQVEDGLNNVNAKGMTNRVQQAVQQVKQKIHEVKNTGVDKQLQAQFNKAGASVEKYQSQLDQVKEKLRQVYAEMDNIQVNTWKAYTPDGVEIGNKAIEPAVSNDLSSNKQYQSLSKQAAKLEEQIVSINAKLNTTKQEYGQIAGQIQELVGKQNIWSNAINKVKSSLSSLKGSADNVRKSFNQLPSITTKINAKITKMSKGMKQGLGHVLRYAGALFSLESIYTMLSSSANAWLSSQNAQAQQLNANIEYMKYAMGSSLAPIIQFVTNLVYQLMKAIQSVAYALTGVNIFANASADAYSNMASSASDANKATKQLAGVHSEINNISSNDSNAGSGGSVAPSLDLSQIDSQMSPLAQKLYNFFKPLVDSWNTYGASLVEQIKKTASQIGELLSSVWESFEKTITNGTVYSILENILAIIGNIAQAWANAWNNDNNGTEIIQSFANMINDITEAIVNLVSSTGFQSFLDGILSAISGIVQFLEPIVSGFSEMAGIILEIVMSTIGDVLTTIGNALQTIAQNEIAVEVLKAIGTAIAIIASAIILWNAAQLILNGLLIVFQNLPIILIITALIAVLVLLIMNWEQVSQAVSQAWQAIWNTISSVIDWIVEKVTYLWSQISWIFEAIWEVISTIFGFIWDIVSTVFTAIWNIISPILNAIWSLVSTIFGAIWEIISSILGSVWNIFSQIFNWIWQLVSKIFGAIWDVISPIMTKIWEVIKSVLEKIKSVWTTVWNAISGVVTSIWNGIWGAIKTVINAILGGIEGFVNGIINGINWVLSGISSLANAIGGLIGLDPINLQISTISLPRLAKGAVLKVPTVAEMAEYPGASTNPEIVTPQNIMEETFDRVLARYQNEDTTPIYLTVNVGNAKLGQILLDDLRNMKRRSGKDIEALVGG